MSFLVLPFRIGQKAAEPVSDDFRNLYITVADAFSQGDASTTQSPITTIPVSGTDDLGTAIATIDAESSKATPDLIIVDLANSARQMLPAYSIVNAIVSICHRARCAAFELPRIVFMLSSPLWEDDPPMAVLNPLIAAGKASIITDSGHLIGQCPGSFIPSDYVSALQEARKTPLWLLKHKLVRQHGHFMRYRSGVHVYCVQFFFDGTHCKNDLAHLIVQDYRDELLNAQILVHHPETDWLREAAEAAANRMNATLCVLDLRAEALGTGGSVSDSPVLIIPMCDTSETFKTIIRALVRINPECRPTVISVMSTEGEKVERGRRIVYVDGGQYVINYMLKVDRPRYSPSNCRQCRIGVLGSSLQRANTETPNIPTYAMWSMIFDGGLKPEADVPTLRPSLGLVPDFLQVVAKNGPYLARKMHQLLTKMVGKLPRDPIIICPDEEGARVLTNALTSLFKYTVIRVPRHAIGNPSAATANQSKTSDWLIQLRSLRERRERIELIIFDEFNASGSTRIGLKNLTEAFELGVRCYFSLFDFNPSSNEHLGAEVHSLYSINWLDGEGSRSMQPTASIGN